MRIVIAISLAIMITGFAGASFAQEKVRVDPDPGKAGAGLYLLDPGHTSVLAKISHLGLSRFTLKFDEVKGRYTYDPAKPEATQVTITINPRTVNSGVEQLNVELYGPRWMNSAQYPEIKFVSKSIRRAGGSIRAMTGDLSLMGVTRPVTFEVTYRGSASEFGGTRMGFSATAKIKRSDFGFRTMLPQIGDDVDLIIETEFTKV
jgi:polyisoprenoid-binding protein YceI